MFIAYYIDPEARPSKNLFAMFAEHGVELRWLTSFRSLDLRRDVEAVHAILVDMSSADPSTFEQHVREARSIDLAAPCIGIVPPLGQIQVQGLIDSGFLHHCLERPFDSDDMVNDTMRMIHRKASPPAAKPSEGMGGLSTSDLFSDLLDATNPSIRSKAGVPEQSTPRPEIEMHDPAEPLGEFGNYKLEERIAMGGMAELFKANYQGADNFSRKCAIKRILPNLSDDEEFVAMFRDEARLASSLNHPNVIRTFDFGKCRVGSKSTYFIAMDFIEGYDLNWVIKRLRARGLHLPEPLVALIASKVASALAYLHSHTSEDGEPMHLVHRDVSPHNIMVGNQGQVVILDFGVAKAISKISVTMGGNLKGKLAYMSPEQATGDPVDGRSDLFSLGLLMHECLTMQRCYAAKDGAPTPAKIEVQMLLAAQAAEVPSVRTLNPYASPGIERIVEKLTRKSPADRYQDATEAEKDLKAHLRATQRVEESDLVEFLTALEDPNPEALTAHIEERYREASTCGHAIQAPGHEDAAPADGVTADEPASIESLPPVPEGKPRRPTWWSRIVGVFASFRRA